MRPLRTRALGGLLVAGLLSVLFPGPAQAAETPAPEDFTAVVTPSSPAKGEQITVVTKGWTPGTQLQAVLCGDGAIGGSSTCALPSAVTALTDAKGVATHFLKADPPPKPCPCVVRVSTFTGEAMAANVPITLRGHEVGELPEVVEASGDLRVERVGVSENSTLRTLLGVGGPATLTVTLANRGDAAAPAPDLEYGFGRGDLEANRTHAVDLVVPAGATRQVEIPVEVGAFAFGSQQAVVQFAGGVGGVRSDSLWVFPLGILALLAASLLGVVFWDLRRTRDVRAEAALARPGARRFLDDDGSYPLPEVVYLEDIGGYLIKPVVLKNSRLSNRVEGRVTVRDLAQLVEGTSKALFPDGEPAAAPVGAGGLSQFLRRDRHGEQAERTSTPGSGPGRSFFVKQEQGRDTRPDGSSGPGAGPGLSFFVRHDRNRDV